MLQSRTAPPLRSARSLWRVGHGLASMARSVVVQVAATATVTLAAASLPWLHDGPRPEAVRTVAMPISQGAATFSAVQVPGLQASDALVLRPRLAASHAFPMDGDETFGLSLSRPYPVMAAFAPSAEAAPAAGPVVLRRPAAPDGGGVSCRDCGNRGVQAVAAVLPPPRPPEFAPRPAPEPAPRSVARVALDWLPVPDLPSPRAVGSIVAESADGAGKSLKQATDWAASSLAGLLHLD